MIFVVLRIHYIEIKKPVDMEKKLNEKCIKTITKKELSNTTKRREFLKVWRATKVLQFE